MTNRIDTLTFRNGKYYDVEGVCCNAEELGSLVPYVCTRPLGHAGPHIAEDLTDEADDRNTWPQMAVKKPA